MGVESRSTRSTGQVPDEAIIIGAVPETAFTYDAAKITYSTGVGAPRTGVAHGL